MSGCGEIMSCSISCGGCKMYPGFDESSNTQSFIVGVAPRASFGAGMRAEGDDDDDDKSTIYHV
ncbi:hypothetical protein MKW92_030189 [Papaver armeniacum]|nr:hypothetical protein MKW92_027605 [Papaver armeniacum]KAI3972450.1 hypothetical protein MKW92_030189 [Papaver armeniacum]